MTVALGSEVSYISGSGSLPVYVSTAERHDDDGDGDGIVSVSVSVVVVAVYCRLSEEWLFVFNDIAVDVMFGVVIVVFHYTTVIFVLHCYDVVLLLFFIHCCSISSYISFSTTTTLSLLFVTVGLLFIIAYHPTDRRYMTISF